MKLADLSQDTVARLRSYRWDRIIEKHEGPENWEWLLGRYEEKGEQADFLVIEGRQVLLPIGKRHHPHITVLRCIVAAHGDSLTIFLKDTTFAEYYGPGDEWIWAGYVAVCDKLPGNDFYVAVLYHEWFIIPSLAEQ